MKITVDIDCSPEEARAFLGLPDVAGMQKAMMDQIQSAMMENLQGMDAETMFKNWMPVMPGGAGALDGLESIQKAFWSQMAGAAATKD